MAEGVADWQVELWNITLTDPCPLMTDSKLIEIELRILICSIGFRLTVGLPFKSLNKAITMSVCVKSCSKKKKFYFKKNSSC